ncbi:hypothetical protein Rumeso_04860 [Rubellimicrobium mesophilum DSM 19309]|uniref:Uncharacterized protein n=1 Tax=Rubellimicrobium mesophilum DSM 19309 TaxID=442562 RepID=A0A017HCS5_9RHOB|nr:hypothetical protein Rumeso_04860 [Rubellimicrobium mesophilum DSM 19309]
MTSIPGPDGRSRTSPLASFEVPIRVCGAKARPSVGQRSPSDAIPTGAKGKSETSVPGSSGSASSGGAWKASVVGPRSTQGRSGRATRLCSAASSWSRRPPAKPSATTAGASMRVRALSKSVVSCSGTGWSRPAKARAASSDRLSMSPITATGSAPAASTASAPPSAATRIGARRSERARSSAVKSAPPTSVTGSRLWTMAPAFIHCPRSRWIAPKGSRKNLFLSTRC